jgi:Methyltransferase domain
VTSPDTIAPQSLAHREAEFYDHRSRTYDVVRSLIQRSMRGLGRYAEPHRYFDPAGKHVLLYAPVPESVSLFERGAALVTGIDVSERELERARRAIEDKGYGDRFRGLIADAHRTPFEDASFDVIVGGSVLHHLDLPVALREIRRTL